MGILDTILVIILIANDFSFLEIIGIMLLFTPIFYGIILPVLFGTFANNTRHKKNNKKEIKELVDKILASYSNYYIGVSDLKKSLYAQIDKTTNDFINEFNLKNYSEKENFVYHQIINTIYIKLSSGEYHIYAGTLNTMNGGDELYMIYKGLLNTSVEKGFISKKAKSNDLKKFEDMIYMIG